MPGRNSNGLKIRPMFLHLDFVLRLRQMGLSSIVALQQCPQHSSECRIAMVECQSAKRRSADTLPARRVAVQRSSYFCHFCRFIGRLDVYTRLPAELPGLLKAGMTAGAAIRMLLLPESTR